MFQSKPHNLARPHLGFTTAELLIVVALIATIGTFTAPFFAETLFRKDASSSAALAVDALREAQSAVMSGKNAVRYGVHFETGKFVLFQGATYGAADANNVVHALDAGVTVSAITLSGGGSDVHFADRRGTPTESGSVVFAAAGGGTVAVTVGQAGMFDAN